MENESHRLLVAALADLERACAAIDTLRRSPTSPGADTTFELDEASHAAHHALLVLRSWDWAPAIAASDPPVAADRH